MNFFPLLKTNINSFYSFILETRRNNIEEREKFKTPNNKYDFSKGISIVIVLII